MRIALGLMIAALFAVGCGHAQTTGSAQNNWQTPTGYASATNPRIVDPNQPVMHSRMHVDENAPPPPVANPPPEVTPPPAPDVEPPPGSTVTPPLEPGPNVVP